MASEWYSDGLRFECTLCGACCTGAPGYVVFTDEEAGAIAERLGIGVAAFLRDYTHDTRLEAGGRSLNEVKTEHGYDCVFLDRRSIPGRAVCSLYEQRPEQCKTFPWWPEHLESKRSWQRLAKECEGIGRGNVVPVSEIRISRDAHAADRESRR